MTAIECCGFFLVSLTGGLLAAALVDCCGDYWRRRRRNSWPKVLTVGQAEVTLFADGMMIYRRADGTLWAENLTHRDQMFAYASATHLPPAGSAGSVH